MKAIKYNVGDRFVATIKAIHVEGVNIIMPDGKGAGVISPRCWGNGVERRAALAALRPGEKVHVVVKKYSVQSKILSLVLDSDARSDMSMAVLKVPRKPDYQPIPEGTVFLWDVANLFGKIGPEDAAWRLESIARSMEMQGYRSLFFIERRSLTWAKHNQLSAADVEALEAFARRDDFSVVADGGKDSREEADCAILQVAEAIPNSVCVSHDRYGDYAIAHSGIVGTDRVRSFTVSRLNGELIISVSGLKRAIVVEPRSEEIACDSEMVSASEAVSDSVADARSEERHTGIYAVADKYMRRGDAKNAERIYSRVAKKYPVAYKALADMYCKGVGVHTDVKKVAHFEHLAQASAKRIKEREVRDRRRRVQSIRSGCVEPHFAAKRMQALNMVAFYEKNEKFAGTKKRHFTLGHAA